MLRKEANCIVICAFIFSVKLFFPLQHCHVQHCRLPSAHHTQYLQLYQRTLSAFSRLNLALFFATKLRSGIDY